MAAVSGAARAVRARGAAAQFNHLKGKRSKGKKRGKAGKNGKKSEHNPHAREPAKVAAHVRLMAGSFTVRKETWSTCSRRS